MDTNLLKSLLKPEEGLKLLPYKDSVGKLTIGWGRNLSDNGISRTEAEIFLNNDIEDTILDLDQNVGWWRDLDEIRQLVFADMCFNLGIPKFLEFHKFLNAAKNRQWQVAHDEMLNSQWATEVGERAIKLAKIFLTGIYVPENKVSK